MEKEKKKNAKSNKKDDTINKAKQSSTKKATKTKLESKEPSDKVVKEEEISKSKRKNHFSYQFRLVLASLLFVISLAISFMLAPKAFEYINPKIISYSEQEAVNYRVYLKENEFYDEDYLDENMIYVANLIDNIKLDFKYNFNIEEKSDIKFSYQLLGKLIIGNPNSSANYLEKDYILSDKKEITMNNELDKNILESIQIDYDYYNEIANNYKSQYAVDTNSYLKVFLRVQKESNGNDNLNINDYEDIAITIPLSEKAVEITINAQNNSTSNKAVSNRELIFNKAIFVGEVIFCVIAIVSLIELIQLLALLTERKNAYDLYVNKILREYDRLIAETTTGVDLEKNNIIKVSTFEELLDVRDNLKLPIMYYPIAKHNKCQFYIKNDNDVYLVTIKEVDLEGRENEKK